MYCACPSSFLHTVCNQKLDGGKAWEGGYIHTCTHTCSKDSLCTTTSESETLLFKRDIAEMLMLALQVYFPPWEVCNESKVRIRVVFVPVVTELPTVMSFPPTTRLSLSSHSRVGSTTKFSTTVAVQVRVCVCPAVEAPLD